MSKKTNIITVVLAMLILTGWFFDFATPYYLIPLAITYLVITTLGTLNMRFNFFLHAYCKSSTTKKEIALTFDDGPHPDITPQLIKLLDLNNVPASFFCIGKNIDANSEIVTQMHNSNHIIGNHSYGHSNFFDLFSSARMQKEIVNTNIAIKKAIGKTPLLFRPPYGITNPMLSKAIKKSKKLSIGWSLRSLDTYKNSNQVLIKLKANTKAGDIVLFHDTNPNIVSIIEDYLIWLQENDFKIVSLTNLLNIPAYED